VLLIAQHRRTSGEEKVFCLSRFWKTRTENISGILPAYPDPIREIVNFNHRRTPRGATQLGHLLPVPPLPRSERACSRSFPTFVRWIIIYFPCTALSVGRGKEEERERERDAGMEQRGTTGRAKILRDAVVAAWWYPRSGCIVKR